MGTDLEIRQYHRDLRELALPISLQCLLQASFSVVDQIMIGGLGSESIAAIGLAGKFVSLLTVMVQAVAAVAGIVLSQSVGKGDREETGRGLYTNLALAFVLAAGFTLLGRRMPGTIMGIYSGDPSTVKTAAEYLSVYALSFLPMALTSLMSTYLRCHKQTKIPLYTGICSAVANTFLNWVLIYGKLGCPRMGVRGAAWASVAAQAAGCLVIGGAFLLRRGLPPVLFYRGREQWRGFLKILLPLFICEFVWVLGENVYGYLYGHMGTGACAAMTLTNPVVSLTIGALTGVAQAAGILVGQLQGKGDETAAYRTAKRLMKTGLAGSVGLTVLLLVLSPLYVRLFKVEPEVGGMTLGILAAFGAVLPLKVENMILGGGILRSGGKTRYVMVIDMLGTWAFGVPMGFLAAFAWGLPIPWVYFLLSLEEGVRLTVSLVLFRRRVWMQRL